MGTLGKMLKIISIIGLVFVIIISVFGFLALSDAKEFREKAAVEPNLFLLVDDGKLLAGAKDLMHNDNPKQLTVSEMAEYQGFLDNKDYKALVGNNYKVIITTMPMFDSMPDSEIPNTDLKNSDIISALKSGDVRGWFIDKTIEKTRIPDEQKELARKQLMNSIPEDAELRSNLFITLLGLKGQSEGPLFLIKECRKDNIQVYPETTLFRFIKFAPQSAIDMAESRMAGAG